MDSMTQEKIHKGDFDLSVGVDVRSDGEDVTFHVKPGQLGGLCCSGGPCACHELRRPFLQGGRLFAPEDLGRSVPGRCHLLLSGSAMESLPLRCFHFPC